MVQISRPAFRYHGAKWLLAPWVIEHLPGNHDLYCEPFGGSGGVLLRKKRSPLEVFNDLDDEVVNFFRVLREQEDELVRAIWLTPYGKTEHELAKEYCEDALERARRFYVLMGMGVTQRMISNPGWAVRRRLNYVGSKGNKKRTSSPATTFMVVEHLYTVAERMRGVIIEKRPAIEVMHYYDDSNALFYVDPPYVMETRTERESYGYKHEMSNGDHIDLAMVLHGLKGMVVLSGYRCALYDELFGGWERFDRTTRVQGTGIAMESLWLSPRVSGSLKNGRQMDLL